MLPDMTRRFLLAPGLVAVGFAVTAGHPSIATRTSPGEIRTYWSALQLVGFRGVGLVEENGKSVFLEGSGGLSPEAVFNVASIAKSITAVAVLRLAREGRLHMEDTLRRFFPDAPADKSAITIHQLLTHTSGLGNPTGDTAMGVRDRAEAVRMILATPLVDSPGTAYNYSNDGYTLLAAVLEVATSQTWEAVLRKEVLKPAGMTQTFFLGERLPGGAKLAQSSGKDLFNRPGQWGSKGGAGILSTARDLERFMDVSANGSLLSAEDRRELGTSYAHSEQLVQYSRVFNIRKVPGAGSVWSHGGADSDFGHYSFVEYYPERRVVLVLLALDDESLANEAATGLRNAVFARTAREDPPGRRGRAATNLETATLEGDGLRFTLRKDSAASLVPENDLATEFIAGRSKEEREKIQGCVLLTRNLLDEAEKRAASAEPLPEGPVGRFFGFWRQSNDKDGPVKSVTVLGATSNWVDTLGGMLSFVKVQRERASSMFRLYWVDGKLRARGGSAIPNPAPLRVIDFGDSVYGAWNPALGRYAELRFLTSPDGTKHAILTAGDRTADLRVSPGS
jgi:CubicO group peptidase (beta-lactamase class C family)